MCARMNKQLRFLFDLHDNVEFTRVLEETGGEVERESERQWFLRVSDVRIQYLRCEVFDDFITIGRIAFRTMGKTDKRVIKAYKHIESWVKENCTNRLFCRNVNIDGSGSMVDDVWVGPSAKALAESGEKTLKQSRKGFIVFEMTAD